MGKEKENLIEELCENLPCPMFVTIGIVLLIFHLIGHLFSKGQQIYPIYNKFLENESCPECRAIDQIQVGITERQCRIMMNSSKQMARQWTETQLWRLIRIKISGQYLQQEMRSEDKCGIYSMGPHNYVIHFELLQEGETSFDIYCLDKKITTINSFVQPYDRPSQYTIFHLNQEFTNICMENNKFVIFTQSNLIGYKVLGDAIDHKRQPKEDYSKLVSNNYDNAFMFDMNSDQINSMSTLEQFEKIIIPSFNHARNGDVIIFKNPDVPENIKDIVRKASGNRLVPMVQRICFGHLAIAQNNERIEEEEDFDQLRSNIVPENSSRGDVIYLNVKKTLLPLLNLENVKKLEFDGNQIKSLSTAKALISYDDNDLVLNGLWLPKESPIILIMKDVNSDLSQAAKYLESSNHKIIRVNEDIEKIKSEISKI